MSTSITLSITAFFFFFDLKWVRINVKAEKSELSGKLGLS